MMDPSVDIADRTTATSALDDELEAELTSSRAKPRPSSTTSRSSSGRGTHVTSQGPRTSTTSSTTHRNSVFGRMSSGIGGKNPLRDTFFKSKSDPLDESSQNEFNLTIIDEEGLISKNKHEHDSTNADANSSSAASSSSGHSSTASYIVVGIAVVTVLFTYIATLLSPTLDGYEIDPGLVLGSLQTLLLCTVVVITYNGVQVFQAHPNPLIMYKCVIDIILAMRFLLDPWLLRVGVYQVGKRESCAYLSGFTQFLYFSSDCWYFAMILDLHKSLTNPFTSVKADRKKYIIAVCLVGLASGIVTSSVGSFHGFADGNYCWTHRGDRLERNFWRLNVASWTLFYDWMIVFYLSGIGVLIYGRRRLKSGLKLTLDSRLEMRRNSAISIMSYTGYWTIAFTWYAISFSARTHYEADGHMSPSKVFRSYSYTLAGRGVVDYFVWFMINKPSRMKAHWMKFTSESADQKFSAQLNTALQRELIFFTNEGMIRAVQLADEELMRKRERSPTQELVLAAAADNDTIDDAASARSSVVSFETPSDAPVMNLNHGASDRTLTMADLSSTSGEEEPRSTGDSGRDSKKLKPSRRSFLTYLGFSAPSTHTSSQPPPGSLRSISQREAPINASAASSTSYTSEQSIMFTPYKSEAFAELRSACGIKTDDFMKSFEASTKPSISEGASGAFMFFSGDKKFIVKSMAEEECRFLIDIADAYVEYLITNPWSLITKFFGCFKITLYEKKFYFVVMENLFDVMEQGVTIHHRYDIKGSWVNRSYSRPRRGAKLKCRHCSMQFKYGGSKAHMRCPNVVGFHEPNVVLKDNDLRTRMRIGTEAGIELYEHLREDSLFLCSLGIMDYSLLLGVTDIEFIVDPPAAGTDDSLVADMQRRNTVTSNITLASTASSSRGRPQNKPRAGSGNSTTSTMSSVVSGDGRGDRNHTTLTRESLAMLEEEVPSLERGNSNSTVGAIGAASAFRTHSHGHSSMSVSARGIVDHPDKDSSGHDATVLPPTLQTKHSMRKSERVFGPGYYYIGIIDILQQWNNQKRLERFWKVNVRRCDGNGLSAIDPVRYQRRFEAKLREIIAIPKDFTPRSPLPAILDSSRRGTGRYRARSSGAESAMRGSHGGGMVTGGGGVPDHRLSDDVEGHEDLVDLEQGIRKHPEQILMRVGSHQRRTRITSPGAVARDSMHAV